MAKRFEVTIVPTGGTITKLNPSDTRLFTKLIDGSYESNDVGGYNFDLKEQYGEVKKSIGHAKWSSSVASTGGSFQEMMVLDDGSNKNVTALYKGKFYKYATSKAATEVAASPIITFDTVDLGCMIQYGAYVLITCGLDHTPYKWKHGDATISKLITSGTEYKFKYLEQFHNRIIGAYTDQDNGVIDIRWTDALPSFTALSFPAANQLYKPDNDIGITGIKRFGDQAVLVYGRDSVHVLDYYPYETPVFSMSPVLTGIGTSSHHSIVDFGVGQCFFNRNRGFVEYLGGRQYSVISDPVESWISSINAVYYKNIYGKYLSLSNEIAWLVPLDGSANPNAILYYNITTKQWRKEVRDGSCLIYDQFLDTYTWTDLIADSEETPKWPDASTGTDTRARWSDYLTIYGGLLFGNDNGYIYYFTGNDADGSDLTGYRIEPIIGFPNPTKHKRLQEIHMVSPSVGAFNVDIYYRGADTQQDVNAAAWTSLGSISMAALSDMVLYTDYAHKFFQLKWGTDLKNERFAISKIILKGIYY